MTADLQNPIFNDLDKAREALEAARWPNGPFCPHCGATDRQARVEGKSHRPGLIYCNHCQGQYTVTVGTVFERSKVPLTKWWLATHLLTSSKKGMSAHQMHRMLGVTYKTAWFMAHRIREAMADKNPKPMGGEGKTIEADETYFGNKDVVTKRTKRGKSGLASKRAVVALVEREGKVRTFHVERADKVVVTKIVRENIARETQVYTDESRLYTDIKDHVAGHDQVHHTSGEYVRYEADKTVHTNTIEGYFSIFKRGMKGVYQHCGEQHLHRYLAEFDFRYNHRTALAVNDAMRAVAAIKGAEGKRLTYRRSNGSEA
jgi:transposase-like protein